MTGLDQNRPAASLDGRVAIVTGGGHGMGRSHCLELTRRGASVSVADIDYDAARATAAAVTRSGRRAVAVECDVRSSEQVHALATRTAEELGGIDIVVSNAGINSGHKPLRETTLEEWRDQLAVNLDGAFLLVGAALPWLERSPAGRVILVSSQWGQVGPGFAHGYVAAKGGLLAFAKNLALELAPVGILVNAIAPGTILTRMLDEEGIVMDNVLRTIPIGRAAEPREVSYLVSFLASDEAAFITGQTLPINGGVSGRRLLMKVALIPGDGVGPEVVHEARLAVDALGVGIEWTQLSWGFCVLP